MNFEVHIRVMSFLARQAVKLCKLGDRPSPPGLSSRLRCSQAGLLEDCCCLGLTAATVYGLELVMEKKSVSPISDQ